MHDGATHGAVRIRVLGNASLEAGGDAIAIGSERQRRLLAALAARCPSAVPTDRLVEMVWGDARPSDPAKALATVVTRLRHTLNSASAGAGSLLVSRQPGYALDLPGEMIDANRFADLVVNGRRHLASGDLESARRNLDQALEEWHGRAYEGFEHEDWARAEADRLERLWVSAREADIEIRLESGQHADALADISALIEDEPFNDNLRGFLMRALYASGRQTEALRALHDYRTLLAEEAGLDPGPDLAQLEQRILAHDETLLVPAGRPLRGYRLHERLALTDRGAVFRATQPGLERNVAIEIIDEDAAGDPDFVRSFELQGRALAHLGHAHVAPVIDCWRDPDGAYLVRRLLSGGTLADADIRDRLGPEGLARVRDQVRSALDVAHDAGLVHGPIDAADIQLDDHDTAYLANFRLGAPNATPEEDDRSFDRLFDALVGPTLPTRGEGTPSRVGNPYRGLSAFATSDVDIFFGRHRLIEAALHTLHQHGAAFLVGPSGSGKSSLVHAGVVPALAAGEIEGSERWFVATMVPGTDPFAELEAAVLRVAVHPPAGLLEQLRDPTHGLATAITRVLPEPDATAVVVVDQFEELFTVTADDERDRFIAALGEVLRDPRSPLRIIATLRADFYDQPLARPEIAPLVTETSVPVDALAGDELRDAIVEPARVVGVQVEPGLVGRLLVDAANHTGSLPLLEYTLTRLFDLRRGDTLTLDAYLDLGGLTAAIGDRAEEIHDGLDPPDQDVSRRMFGRLVAVGPTVDTRRRVPLAELRAAEAEPHRVDTVSARFVDARLLITDRDPATRQPTLEVAHEALFREWPRLTGWIDDDRATIAAIDHLGAAALGWRVSGDDSELYRGARLSAALDLLADHGDRLTPDERAFVDASRDLAETEQRHQQRTNRRLRSLLIAAGVLLVVALVAGLTANEQRTRANEQRGRADERAAAADLQRLTALGRSSGAVSPEVAVLAALEAHRLEPTPDTLEALHWALTADPAYRGTMGDRPMGGDITVLDGGRRIVTHTSDTVEVWDVETRTQIHSWPFPGAEGVTGHTLLRSTGAGDGSLLVTGAPNVTTVIETTTGATVASIEHSTPAVGIALSPDARFVAVGLDDGTVEIWPTTDPTAPVAVRESDEAAPTLRWHSDGLVALGTTGGDVVLWDPGTGDDRWTYEGTIAPGPSDRDAAPVVLFSSDGERLVVAGLEASSDDAFFPSAVVELAVADGEELTEVALNQSGVRSLTWLDADETTVVSSGLFGANVEITDLRDPSAVSTVRIANFEASAALPELGLIVSEAGIGLDIHAVDGSNPLVRWLSLPPGRNRGVNGSLDALGTQLIANFGLTGSEIIDLDGAEADWQPFGRADDASVLFALGVPDGSRLLTAGADGWGAHDWAGNRLSGPVAPPRDEIPTLIYVSPEGDRLVVTVAEEDILLDLTGDELRELAVLPKPASAAVCCSGPSFSTDGALFSRPDRAGSTELFDAASGVRIPFDHDVEAQLFGPRDTWFAAVDDRGTIHLHDQVTGERIGSPMVGNRGPITSLLPTYDQRRFAAIGADGSTRVWDLETTTQVGRPIETTHAGGFRSWSGDGRYLALYHLGDDGIGRIEVWNFDTDTWPALGCELAGRNMTEDEWAEFGPRTIERRATCPQFPL